MSCDCRVVSLNYVVLLSCRTFCLLEFDLNKNLGKLWTISVLCLLVQFMPDHSAFKSVIGRGLGFLAFLVSCARG